MLCHSNFCLVSTIPERWILVQRTRYISRLYLYRLLLRIFLNTRTMNVDNSHSFVELTDALESGDETKLKSILNLTSLAKCDWIDSESGQSVLHIASRSDHGFMEGLLDREDIRRHLNGVDLLGATPLISAVSVGNISAIKLLLDTGASTANTLYNTRQNALHVAVSLDKCDSLNELLKYNTLPDFLDAFDANGNTPLMLCAVGRTSCALQLLEAGANVSVKNPLTGRNVLHLCVLDSNKTLAEILINLENFQQGFINSPDAYGDSPLRLAVLLKEIEIVRLLVFCSSAKELVREFPDIVHHVLTFRDSELMARVLTIVDKEDLATWTDPQGRTAFMVAVETGQPEAVRSLIEKGVGTTTMRDYQGQTVLHKAVMSGSPEILTLTLDASNVEDLFNLNDHNGRTALEAALALKQLEEFAIMWKSGLFPDKPLNDRGESALFIAAKENNYGCFLMLLMSSDSIVFIGSLLNNEVITDVDLKRAYLQKNIYASDLYIMTGNIVKDTNWHFCPPFPDSFRETKNKRNVFHACALGGYVDLIIFFYRFCEVFYPCECNKIDDTDARGATPLLLATQCDHKDVMKFLLQKGANLCKADEHKDFPLSVLHKSVYECEIFISEMFSDCIVSKGWPVSEEVATEPDKLTIHFYLLTPRNEPSMRVTSEIFRLFDVFEENKILSHPFLRFFIMQEWDKLHYFMKLRYYSAIMNSLSFTLYLLMKYCVLVPKVPIILSLCWWVSLVSYTCSGLWALPLTFIPSKKPWRWFEGKALLLPSVLGIWFLVFLDGYDRTSLEIGAWAVLFTWLALLSFGVASPLSKQKAMFQVVFSSMYPYLPIYFLVTAGFCFYFFVLFHDYFVFNNPFHSLLFAAFQLPRGDLNLIPVLTDETKPFRGKNSTNYSAMKETSPNEPEAFDNTQELRSMTIEGSAMIIFLMVTTAVTNMLTALAVKSGDELIRSGDVYELASQVDRLEKWEMFLYGRGYSFLEKLHLLWLMAIPRSARERFRPPPLSYPLVHKPKNFELFMIENNFTKKENLISNKTVKFFLEWYHNKEVNMADQWFFITDQRGCGRFRPAMPFKISLLPYDVLLWSTECGSLVKRSVAEWEKGPRKLQQNCCIFKTGICDEHNYCLSKASSNESRMDLGQE